MAVGGSTTFTVEFKPTTTGNPLNATVSFAENDPTKPSPFTFAISGQAVEIEPQMTLSTGGQLVSYGSEATPGTGTVFNLTVVGTSSYVTYYIANNGFAPLTLGTVSVAGTDASLFTVTKQPDSSVAVGGSTTFVVEFKPTAVGVPSAALYFTENDPNEPSPFIFGIAGVGTPKQSTITVSAGGQSITDGSTTPSASNGTAFTSTAVGKSNYVTYSIANSGSGPLNLGTVSISGTGAADFTVTKQPDSVVSVGGSTTFTVLFKPTTVGLPTATVSFTENDPFVPSPFTFAISGIATAAPAVVLSGNSNSTPVTTNAPPIIDNVIQSPGQPITLLQGNHASVRLLAIGTGGNQAELTPAVNYPADYPAVSPTVATPSAIPNTTAVGSGSTESSAAVTPTVYMAAYGRHYFKATDEAVSDFDLADLWV